MNSGFSIDRDTKMAVSLSPNTNLLFLIPETRPAISNSQAVKRGVTNTVSHRLVLI